jgi:epoxyqueuosine reductase
MIFSTSAIKDLANTLGFELFGVAKSFIPNIDKENFKSWIKEKLYGTMEWFPKNEELRTDFKNLGFTPKSALVLGVLYIDKDYSKLQENFDFHFSRYAVGKDYHTVIREMAKPLLAYLRNNFPDYHFRQSVDSLPVSEKVLAREAGIGWIGKHTNLINEKIGSWFFLSTILTDAEFTYSVTGVDRCGTCRACLDACPTGALFDAYKIDAGKCISHHTIEDKSEKLNEKTESSLHGWIYGCDICQEVCPWNKVKQEKNNLFTKVDAFKINPIFKDKTETEFLEMNESTFINWTKVSAISRIGYKQFKRNIEIYSKNIQYK